MPPRHMATAPIWKLFVNLLPTCWSRRLLAALVALVTLAALGACGLGQRSTANNLPPGSGTVYVAAGPLVQALASGNGKPRWQDRLTGASSGMASNGTTLFVSSSLPHQPGQPGRGTLKALRASTGAEIWARDYADAEPIPIGATANTVLVVTGLPASGANPPTVPTLAALRARDGAPIWSVAVQGGPHWMPIMGGDMVYLLTPTAGTGTPAGPTTLFALGAGDGKVRWQLPLARPPISGPIFSAGVLYLARDEPGNPIVAVNGSDGKIVWQTNDGFAASATNMKASRLLAGDGTVFSISYSPIDNDPVHGEDMVARRASDGTILWQRNVSYYSASLLAVNGNVLYYTDYVSKSNQGARDMLIALDAQTAGVVFEREVPACNLCEPEYMSSTGTSDGMLILTAFAADPAASGVWQRMLVPIVFAVGASDGTLKWTDWFGVNQTISLLLAAGQP
jgi:outer membrane protein assembly factor BamB